MPYAVIIYLSYIIRRSKKMKRKSLPVILAAILATTTLASANPIPWPPPASMPLEQMYVEIQRDGNDLHAVFTGDFTFTYIPNDVIAMLFPVPPDANNIGVWQDNVELAWTWSSEEYPTILPEMPTIPMIEWQGPFPLNGAVFRVDYEHDLIERPNEFIFFYALGTGKYFPTYEKTTTAHFDILLPVGFTVAGVWLDDVPHAYQVDGYHLTLTVQSYFGPIVHDLIVSLVRGPAGNDCNGNGIPDGEDLSPVVDFSNRLDYTVGDRPSAVACADLNGDSTADLAVTNTNSDNISVLMNNGDGTFTSAVDYSVGDFPVAVTAGDFDGDGDVDLALANDHSDNISVLLNNGDGTFASRTDYTAGDGPCSIKTADLNGDSNLDLMVVNKWDQSVSLLFNNGNGTFVRAANYTVGKYPSSITYGDFNGDTKADLAVGAVYSLAILLNNGNGTFAPAIYYDVGQWPEFVTCGDFDTDGDLDLAVADTGLNIALILRNDGTGTFTPGPKYGVRPEPSCIIAPDLDDDGDLDLAIASRDYYDLTLDPNDGLVSILLNQGDGSFRHGRGVQMLNDFLGEITTADLNNDSLSDLVIANAYASNTVSVLLNQTPEPTSRDWNNNGVPDECENLKTGDFDFDGDYDINDLCVFAARWLTTECKGPCWCGGTDIDENHLINFADFAIFADNWLKGEGDEPGKPGLARYYVPYDNLVEPSAPGYSLPLNLGAVGNYADMDSKFGLSSVAPLLEQNGFAVMEYDFHDSNDIVKPYEYLRKMDVPLFVTADTLLHLYHVQFDETLKDVEEREFVSDINELTAVLLDGALGLYEEYTGDLKEAARRNVAYLAVAQKLIDPNAEVPQLVSDVVASELAKIDAHEGFAPSDIFIYLEDYSQYVPRGHYTRSEELKRYFRTLMWYGRMAFLLKGAESWGPMGEALISVYDAKVQTMQAVLLATSIEEVKVGARSGRDVWDRLYAVTSFYVGLADDLTPYEYLGALNKVFGSSFVPTDLENEDNFFALKVELALLRSPKINGGTGNIWVPLPITPQSLDEVLDKTKGMRFMGQRFIPDSYMFQQLVTPKVLDYTGDGNPIPFSYGNTPIGPQRCYPRGLDVMAILGSARAETILAAEGDTDYVDYALRFNELKAEFDTFDISDWNRNLYWGWLYSLRALIDEFGEGYPNFMRTQAWEKKELNAALASWTELRHDTILYAKQSYTPPTTGPPPPPPPDVTGYVEPVPEFYGRLLALTRMTRQGLSSLDVLSAQATERLVNLENILSRLIEISNKELMNQTLSNDDYEYIMGFGETLEGAVIGVEEKGVKTTLVADVHTYSWEEQVVEEGVGYVDLIIVACPIPDGSIVLSAGPVLSYYEFKHPMSDRLTDEAWRELLDSPQRPDRPTWWF